MKTSKSAAVFSRAARLGGERDDVVHRHEPPVRSAIKMMKTAEDISDAGNRLLRARDNRHQGIKHHERSIMDQQTGLSAQDAEMSAIANNIANVTPLALSATG